MPDPATICGHCHAQLPDPHATACPYCGAVRWAAPPVTGDLPPIPTPWTGGHTPYTPSPWQGQTPYTPSPWALGHTPTPYPSPSAPPEPAATSARLATADLPWSNATPTPASWPPSSRPPVDHAVTHANLFEDVPEVQTSSTDLYVVGKDSSRRISSSPPPELETQRLVVVPRTPRSEELIRRHTVGLHVSLSRTVASGRPSWVVSGLSDTKATLLVAQLDQLGLRAESILPEQLDQPEAPVNLRYVGTIAAKALVAAALAFFFTIFFAAEYISPVVGDWTVALQASLRGAVGLDQNKS